MTTPEPPPMSDALRSLVDADNRRPGPSEGVRTSVYAALGVSLGVLPAGAIVAAHAARTAAAAQATATAAHGGTSAVATTLGAASAVARVALVAKAPLVSVGLGALLGATLTAYVVKGPSPTPRAHSKAAASALVASPARASMAPPEERPAASESASPAEAVVAPRTIKSSTAAMPHHALPVAASPLAQKKLGDELPSVSNDSARSGATSGRADAPRAAGALAAEQELLDPARVALAHGDGAAALARLDLHERRFPVGALSQEREAMAIRALVLTGERDSARGRAESFRSRYPDSLLWPMIDATLRARP